MGNVRPMTRNDIPQFVKLYRRVSTLGAKGSDEELAAYFRKVYFDHPWYDERFPSLVYEETGAGIIGSLGATPRPMTHRGRPIQSVISTNFLVDPDYRNSLAGISLLKTYFSGSQDLAICDGNEKSRALWEALGGSVSLSQSLGWTFPLRPFAYLLRQLHLPQAVAAVPDWLAGRMPRSPFRQEKTGLVSEKLSAATFFECIETCTSQYTLKPVYDEGTSGWMLNHLERKSRTGTLHGNLLRDDSGKIRGMFLWYLNRQKVARLMQLVSRHGDVADVFAHLLHAAWAAGATTLSGRLEPELTPCLEGTYGLLRGRAAWLLIRAADPDLLQAIQSGNAMLTLLESEWWVNYAEDSE